MQRLCLCARCCCCCCQLLFFLSQLTYLRLFAFKYTHTHCIAPLHVTTHHCMPPYRPFTTSTTPLPTLLPFFPYSCFSRTYNSLYVCRHVCFGFSFFKAPWLDCVCELRISASLTARVLKRFQFCNFNIFA